MMKIKIIALGSLKEKYLREASAEYEKRLRGYCSLEIAEIEPVRLPDKPSEGEIAAALEKEAGLILKKIPDGSAVFALCIEGKSLSSTELAAEVASLRNMGRNLTFIIGSSCGLADKVKQKAGKKLSFSAMTFPHQLFRIMLLEQIYRAFKISEGGAYHK